MTAKPELKQEDLPLHASAALRDWLHKLHQYHTRKANEHSRQRMTGPPDKDNFQDRQRHIFQAHAHENRAAICKGLLAATDPEVDYSAVTE